MRWCLFGGSSVGTRAEFVHAAETLGEAIARRGDTLVYGGGSVGLMGVVAKTVAKHGGKDSVQGFIPEAFVEDVGEYLGQTKIVKTVSERKAFMFDNSDAFIAIPGSYGTLDEILSAVNWRCYGAGKPIGLLNIRHFFDKLLEQFDTMVEEGFLKPGKRDIMMLSEDPIDLLQKLEQQVLKDNASHRN